MNTTAQGTQPTMNAPARGARPIMNRRAAASLPPVVYLDDILGQFHNDDTGLPPRDGDHGGRHEPQCIYASSGFDDDEDFADLDDPHAAERHDCHEKPEYYIKAYRSDPGDTATQPETYYYCPRHFAANIGYLCDVMTRRTPDLEIQHFIEHGELPPRYTIQEWGPLAG